MGVKAKQKQLYDSTFCASVSNIKKKITNIQLVHYILKKEFKFYLSNNRYMKGPDIKFKT